MRYTLAAASALCGIAYALPQMIDFAALPPPPASELLGPPIDSPPAPIPYNQAAAIKSVANDVAAGGIVTPADSVVGGKAKRNACVAQPRGAGPVPGDGSVGAYQDPTNVLHKAAQAASTPSGYTQNFVDLSASVQELAYLTYKNIDSGKYDVQACADFCDHEKLCYGFNIFYERDPAYDQTSSCNDPTATTNVKCSIYGYPVSASTATNPGLYRGQFQVVIVGSNGYSKINPTCKDAPTLADFNAPVKLPGAVNSPSTFIGYTSYTGPFDPSLCATACKSQTQYDKQHLVDANGNYDACNFFVTYILTKNDVPQGFYCADYTKPADSSLANNYGYTSGTDVYKVVCPYSYTLSVQDPGKTSSSTKP
ncbi:hypothetical protein ACEQ8H_002840 [Pleosporales sp. CAS-2024a]